MKKLILLALALVTGFTLLLVRPALAADNAQASACEGIGLAAGQNGCTDTAGSPTVERVIKAAVTILSYVVGVASVIMITIGAFKYVTSSGDSGKISNAKSTIMYALIGLVIAALAQVIIRFVLHQTTTTQAPQTTAQCQTTPC